MWPHMMIILYQIKKKKYNDYFYNSALCKYNLIYIILWDMYFIGFNNNIMSYNLVKSGILISSSRDT